MRSAPSFVAALCAGAFAVFGGEPFMMLRFRAAQTDGGPLWSATSENLAKYRAACDEVWFSTGIGLPPLAWHAAQSRRLAAAAEGLRKLGIRPGLQFQATLGHGDAISSLEDCSAKNWGGFTGSSGVECRLCSCPRQPAFLAYMEAMARIYAVWKPSTVWIDDDLRINNHEPADGWRQPGPKGCFCARCVAAFSAQEKAPYDRASLVAALGTDAELQKRWDRFSFQSLARVAHVIAAALHEISPDTRMGYQHALREDGLQAIVFEALAEASGHPVRSRPGGGAYFDHDPFALVEKAYGLARQRKSLMGCKAIESFCPEVETCPRTFACRTGRGLVAESFANLALGMDALSYLVMDAAYETPDWYGSTILAPLAAAAPRLRAYETLNRGTAPGGLNVIEPCPPRSLAASAVPLVTGPDEATFGTLLTVGALARLSDAQVSNVFARGVLMDGAAAQELARRGLGALAGGLHARHAPAGVREKFTEDALNVGFVARRSAGSEKFVLRASDAAVRTLGRYFDAQGKDCGASTLCGVSPLGGRWAAVGCGGFGLHDAAGDQLRRLYRLVDYVSCERAPAVFDDPLRAFVVPRVETNGTLRSLFVLNVTIDRSAAVRVRLRGVPSGVIGAWCGEEGAPEAVPLRREGNEAYAVLPPLEAWKAGYLKFVPAPEESRPAPPAAPAVARDPWTWKPSGGAAVTGVALLGDVAYAACGAAGVVAVEITPDGLVEIGRVAGIGGVVNDVAFREGRLVCAVGTGAEMFVLVGATTVESAGRLAAFAKPSLSPCHEGRALVARGVDGLQLRGR